MRAASALGPKQGNPSEAKVHQGDMLELIGKAKKYKNNTLVSNHKFREKLASLKLQCTKFHKHKRIMIK
jgi:hypothetical protein